MPHLSTPLCTSLSSILFRFLLNDAVSSFQIVHLMKSTPHVPSWLQLLPPPWLRFLPPLWLRLLLPPWLRLLPPLWPLRQPLQLPDSSMWNCVLCCWVVTALGLIWPHWASPTNHVTKTVDVIGHSKVMAEILLLLIVGCSAVNPGACFAFSLARCAAASTTHPASFAESI